VNPLGAIYGQVTRARRRWYTRRPHLQRQIGSPVISVGNLTVGGSGKTPVVAAIATLLRDAGYRPAILSRGYKRRSDDSIVIASDGREINPDVEDTGDEPQLLARRLTGVPVVVGANRWHAGVRAQNRLGSRVLILDDGFQHLQLARTVNLLLLSSGDTRDRVVPAGRLREPLDAARHADAVLVAEGDEAPMALARRVGVNHAFTVRTMYEPLRMVSPYGAPVLQQPRRVVTLAGIAAPHRFVTAAGRLGFDVLREISYRDHHWYTREDVARVETAARTTGAEAILTTEKDAVRLEHLVTGGVAMMFLPIQAHIEPVDAFRAWLFERIGPPEGVA
jgi:tetraacyldisaccharide 4'-kinase